MAVCKVMNKFFSEMHYGTIGEEGSIEDLTMFGKALLAIVGADGLSDAEWQTYLELGRHLGAPPHMEEMMRSLDVKSLDLEETLRGVRDSGLARVMLFDAIIVAHADGYTDAEQAAARRAAKLLGIDDTTFMIIENLVVADFALRRARAGILFSR